MLLSALKKRKTLREELPYLHNFIIGIISIACEVIKRETGWLGYGAYIPTTTLKEEAKEVTSALGSIIEEIIGVKDLSGILHPNTWWGKAVRVKNNEWISGSNQSSPFKYYSENL